MGLLALGLLIIGVVLVWLGGRTRSWTGLPSGRIISRDVSGAGQPLYDPVFDLTGRPDYLVERDGRLIPVEIKSGRSHAGPRRSHRMQVAAYCRLVEAVFARRPSHGILRYADRSYAIPFDDRQEAELTGVIHEMRARLGREQDRSHASPERCRACGFRGDCDQALA